MVALEELVVFLLDVGRVRQHHRAEVPTGGGGVHRPVKPFPHEKRQSAAVIDVGMAQHHAVDPAGVEGQLGVEGVGF